MEQSRNNELAYLNWLYHVPGIGRKKLARLLADATAEEIYHMDEETRLTYIKRQFSADQFEMVCRGAAQTAEHIAAFLDEKEPLQLYENMLSKGITFLPKQTAGYPDRLRQMPDAPFAVYIKGNEALMGTETPVIAIIGARDCSEYGRFVAKKAGEICANAGVTVVSGMARGIDGIAQAYTLHAGGRSVGVLGCGVDVCYPQGNKALYDKLMTEGLLVSEYVPGTEPEAKHFPPRNRIIAGLADALIVVEAREKSGTKITIDMALEQGKDVYVVPGRLTDTLSTGCNRMIGQGAEIIYNIEETIWEIAGRRLVGIQKEKALNRNNGNIRERQTSDMKEPRNQRKENKKESDVYGLLHDILDFTPKTVDEIQEEIQKITCVSYSELCSILMTLELSGFAGQSYGRYFRRG